VKVLACMVQAGAGALLIRIPKVLVYPQIEKGRAPRRAY